MKKPNKRDLFTKTEIILSYLYKDIDRDIEQTIKKLISVDKELSIFYKDLIIFIKRTDAGKDEMRKYLEDMQEAKARFNSKLLHL